MKMLDGDVFDMPRYGRFAFRLSSYPLNMTVVSNDPVYWPVLESYSLCSFFLGSCRVRDDAGCILTFNVVSQLPPVPRWYTIGVSDTVFHNHWHPHDISSTQFRERGMLISLLEHLLLMAVLH
jgi:hypothetical protein